MGRTATFESIPHWLEFLSWYTQLLKGTSNKYNPDPSNPADQKKYKEWVTQKYPSEQNPYAQGLAPFPTQQATGNLPATTATTGTVTSTDDPELLTWYAANMGKGALAQFTKPYASLTQAEKDALKGYFSSNNISSSASGYTTEIPGVLWSKDGQYYDLTSYLQDPGINPVMSVSPTTAKMLLDKYGRDMSGTTESSATTPYQTASLKQNEQQMALDALKYLMGLKAEEKRNKEANQLTAQQTLADLRRQPSDWITASMFQNGKTPVTPSWLPQFAPDLVAGKPVKNSDNVKVASGQTWTSTPWSQQEMLKGYLNFNNIAPNDYLGLLERMLPVNNPRDSRWSPANQVR